MLADSWTQLGSEIREFLEGIYRATTAISTMAISKQSYADAQKHCNNGTILLLLQACLVFGQQLCSVSHVHAVEQSVVQTMPLVLLLLPCYHTLMKTYHSCGSM